jgi:hypothetical protein
MNTRRRRRVCVCVSKSRTLDFDHTQLLLILNTAKSGTTFTQEPVPNLLTLNYLW